MAYMSPDMYCGVLNKANKLIDTIEAYLDGRTPDGLFIPITLEAELEDMILECENTKSRLEVAIKGLKQTSPRRSEYQRVLNEIYNAQREMQCIKSIFIESP